MQEQSKKFVDYFIHRTDLGFILSEIKQNNNIDDAGIVYNDFILKSPQYFITTVLSLPSLPDYKEDTKIYIDGGMVTISALKALDKFLEYGIAIGSMKKVKRNVGGYHE